jgi:septal ring factor EnvC (AmiA/AmiB activator)
MPELEQIQARQQIPHPTHAQAKTELAQVDAQIKTIQTHLDRANQQILTCDDQLAATQQLRTEKQATLDLAEEQSREQQTIHNLEKKNSEPPTLTI